MGMIRRGPPTVLVQRLRDSVGARVFFETGTFRGETTRWASREFPQVVTVEAADAIFRETSAQLKSFANIECLFGNSRDVMGAKVPSLRDAAVFWLDAHWSGGITFGESDECPLLQEIAIVNASPHDHCLLVDDARFFLEAPPPPHDIDQWPGLPEVVAAMADGGRRYVCVIEDVIVGVPARARHVVSEYSREMMRARDSGVGAAVRRITRRVGGVFSG